MTWKMHPVNGLTGKSKGWWSLIFLVSCFQYYDEPSLSDYFHYWENVKKIWWSTYINTSLIFSDIWARTIFSWCFPSLHTYGFFFLIIVVVIFILVVVSYNCAAWFSDQCFLYNFQRTSICKLRFVCIHLPFLRLNGQSYSKSLLTSALLSS